MDIVFGKPAAVIKDTLLIADLHLGIEFELQKKGFNIPSQFKPFSREISELSQECERVIVLGDLKHTITGFSWPEKIYLPEFVRSLGKDVILVKGNHDGGIEEYLNIPIISSSGFEYERYWLFHGHAKPGELRRYMVMAHVHPVLRITDSLGGVVTEKVWVKAKYEGKKLLIMPAFNPLITGVDVHEIEGLKSLDLKGARIYSLEGEYLGRV